MATTSNPNPGQTPNPEPPAPPPPRPEQPPRPPRDPNAPPTTPAPTDAELKARTDKEIAERISSPPETPTPTQEEADAIKSGEYDAMAPEGQKVKKRSMAPAESSGSYTTR
jgi:hypothetical protein